MVKVDDNFIIETNRKCYDALGELYTDGAGKIKTDCNAFAEDHSEWLRAKCGAFCVHL